MGLISRLRRAGYVWSWRLRYWWLDTPSGAQGRVVALCLSTLVVVVQFIQLAVAALSPRQPENQHAVIWWVVILIVMLVAAAVSLALMPKQEGAKPEEASGPTTEDGQPVKRYWGTHWIEDEFLLAWKITGRDPIKAKGGK